MKMITGLQTKKEEKRRREGNKRRREGREKTEHTSQYCE